MRFLAFMTLCCASIILCGCANHSRDYVKKGGEIASLTVPPGVPMIKQEPYYPVPVASALSAKAVSLKPPTLQKKITDN